ncbi:MAG: succinate dehydrogenase, cytochrome b556 subunit [Elusimicrobia bacterium]|jgi:succinate dehydrogenase / fumarate reductase cytochrome b subunit|nr:succinate dehydrogenase, cytochrome b556 subunit [Elusimicrobiota bacterium]
MKRLLVETSDLVRYRGGFGHWTFLFHRLTGLGVLVFLLAHIVDTALLGWGPEVFNRVMAIYRHPLFRLSEVFLVASVLFHTLNGVRLIVVDFWPRATRHHRALVRGTWILFVLLMIPVVIIMAHHYLEANPR